MFLKTELVISNQSDVRDHFYPRKFWISPSLQSKSRLISNQVHRIQGNLILTSNFGDQCTLHIATTEEVLTQVGSEHYFVTEKILSDLSNLEFSHFMVSSSSRQCISLCLRNVTIAYTGFNEDASTIIKDKISLLGGKITVEDDVENASVLIANCPIYESVITDHALGIPIVSYDWIDQCFQKLSFLEFKEYLLKQFSGLTFTSTDLEPSQQKLLKSIIKDGGGNWQDVLDDKVNFLIANSLTMTNKIRLAMKIGLPIVTPNWIFSQEKQFSYFQADLLNWWILPGKTYPIFASIAFAIHKDCEYRDILIDLIEIHSGIMSNKPDIYIVPNFYQVPDKKKYVTPTWIWNCFSQKKVLELNECVCYTPFSFSKPIKKLHGMIIVLYRISEPLRSEIAECLRQNGACVYFSFSSKAKVIISFEESEKLSRLVDQLKIHVVKPVWVVDMMKSGKYKEPKNYLITHTKTDLNFLCSSIVKVKTERIHRSLPEAASKGLDDFSDNEPEEKTEIKDFTNVIYSTGSSRIPSPPRKNEGDLLLDIISNF